MLLGAVLLVVIAPGVLADAPEVVITEPENGEVWWGTCDVTWVAIDNEGGPATFAVYYSYDGGVTWIQLTSLSSTLYENWTEYTYEFNTAERDDTTSARLKVWAEDNEGNTVEALSGLFEIRNRLTPPAPASPASGSSIKCTNPTLRWDPAVGPVEVENYTLQLSTDIAFTNVIYTTTVQLTKVTVEQYLSDGWYYWRVRACDSRGALSEWSPAASFEVYTRPPVVTSFAINGGSPYTCSRTVELEISQVNVVQVSLSLDGVDWSEWEPYSATLDFYLGGEDGTYTVYVRGKDITGRVSDVVVDSITLDTHPPTTVASVSGKLGGRGYRGSAVVNLLATDSLSGVDAVYYRVDGGEWCEGSSVVLAEDGEHVVEYYAVDVAGNREQVRTQLVSVYTPVTPFPWGAVLGGVVAAALGLYVGRTRVLPRYEEWRRRRFLMGRWMRGLFTLPEEEKTESERARRRRRTWRGLLRR